MSVSCGRWLSGSGSSWLIICVLSGRFSVVRSCGSCRRRCCGSVRLRFGSCCVGRKLRCGSCSSCCIVSVMVLCVRFGSFSVSWLRSW